MDAATASSSTVTRTLSAVDDKTAEAVASSSASAAGRPKRSAGTKKAVNVSPAAETAEVSAMPKTLPLAFESRVWRDAPSSIVVGVDEAGRGPLAGPVVAAACVIFPPSLWPVLQAAAALKESAGSGAGARSSSIAGSARSTVATTTTTTSGRPPVSGVNDSKQIDEEERELLYPRLIAAPELCFGVSVVDHAVIDRINILQATFLGMSRATASVREEACKRLREAGIDPASVAWSTSTSAATNSSPPEAAAAGPASSSSAAAETTIPQCLLHTVYIDGPKVPFRVGFAATPGGDDPDAPPAPTDDDADGAAGSNSASSSSSSTAGKAGAAGATTASFFSSAPDAGASDVELMGDDGGIQVTINADAGGQTAGAKSANQLAQKEWNVKFRPQIYTRGLQARLGTIHTVQPVIGGDAKVYCIAAASVVAKVVRDRLMRTAHDTWPQYGFLDHKGYGTGSHMAAIAKQGCCPIHRLTFAPLKHMHPAEAEAARGGPLDPKAAAKAKAAAAVTAAGAAKASATASQKQQSGDDGKDESAVAASAESAAARGTAAAAAASGRKRGRPAAAASTSAAAENNTKAVAAAVSSRADRAAKRSRG